MNKADEEIQLNAMQSRIKDLEERDEELRSAYSDVLKELDEKYEETSSLREEIRVMKIQKSAHIEAIRNLGYAIGGLSDAM